MADDEAARDTEPGARDSVLTPEEPAGRPGVAVIAVSVVILIAFFGLLAYSLMTREPLTSDSGVERAGEAAPGFSLAQLNGGGDVALADFEGRPTVINFWASWCAPCRVEMPHLIDAFHRYSPEGVAFIGIGIQDTDFDARRFLDEFEVPVDAGYVMLTDPAGTTTIEYGVAGLPVTFFVDADGTVVTRWAGVLNGDVLDANIAVMRGLAPPATGS